MALARADIAYAYDMLDDPAAFGLEPALALTIVSTLAVNDLDAAPVLASALLARSDSGSQAALRNLVRTWMSRDPQDALDWVLARGAEIDGTVLENAPAPATQQQAPPAQPGQAPKSVEIDVGGKKQQVPVVPAPPEQPPAQPKK